MMKNDLTQLQRLIVAMPFVAIDGDTGKELEAYSNELATLEQDIINGLNRLVCGRQREALVKRQMRQLQMLITFLLSKLQDQQGDLPEAFRACSEEMLYRLLAHQRLHYGHYFDHFSRVPLIYGQNIFAQMKNGQLPMLAGLKKKNVPSSLQEVLTAVFTYQEQGRDITYHKLDYLQALQASLTRFCCVVGNELFEEMLVEYLIYLDFNHLPFIAYVKSAMEKQLLELLDHKAQYEMMCAKERYLSSITVKNTLGFDEKQGGAKSQLLEYVTAYLVYYHRQVAVAVSLPLAINRTEPAGYRIKINLSADALAYLLRLFIEAGIIEATPRSRLFAFIAKYFQTSGIGEGTLSANSLGVKYKQVVQRTATNVRLALKRMTKIVEGNFEG